MSDDDPFDAQHPDNLPAFQLHHQLLDVQHGALPAGITASPGWEAERARRGRYPLEVGWDPRTDRLRIPISYREWLEANLHPNWPHYLAEMYARPSGQAIGFTDWLDGRRPGRGDPTATGGTSPPTREVTADDVLHRHPMRRFPMPADPDPEPQPAIELVDVDGELQLRDPADPPAHGDARVGMRPAWQNYVDSDPDAHPAWRAYLEAIPDGGWPDQTFEEWLLRQPVVALDPPGQGGSPFVCAADTVLPSGWVRGDSASERGPTTALAYDPRRHTVVRTVGAVASATVAALEAAGFKHVGLAPGHAFFVRDRSDPATTVARARHPNRGRSR